MLANQIHLELQGLVEAVLGRILRWLPISIPLVLHLELFYGTWPKNSANLIKDSNQLILS